MHAHMHTHTHAHSRARSHAHTRSHTCLHVDTPEAFIGETNQQVSPSGWLHVDSQCSEQCSRAPRNLAPPPASLLITTELCSPPRFIQWPGFSAPHGGYGHILLHARAGEDLCHRDPHLFLCGDSSGPVDCRKPRA